MLLAVAVLAGCADRGAGEVADQQDAPPVDELSARGGQVCPAVLPQPDDPGYGFGTRDPAHASPSLATPEAGWVCLFNPVDAGAGPDGDGTTYDWERAGRPHEVNAADLRALAGELGELAPPPEPEWACTADLGPRWMFVYTVGDDLTGVVVDDYGCNEVRLTDEPFETPPGDAVQQGTVSGVLFGSTTLLDRLKAVVGNP